MKIVIKSKLSPHKFKTPEGYLICQDAIIGRTGFQEYLKSELFPDTKGTSEGNEIIKLERPEEEVFNETSMASYENKPLTCEHPSEDVTPVNYKQYSVGFVRDVKRGKDNNEDVLLANLIVTDRRTIEDIENGIRTDLSCGYDCDITFEDERAKQTNIRGNHVALCEEGRAGIARIVDSKPAQLRDSKHILSIGSDGVYLLDGESLNTTFQDEAIRKVYELGYGLDELELHTNRSVSVKDEPIIDDSQIETPMSVQDALLHVRIANVPEKKSTKEITQSDEHIAEDNFEELLDKLYLQSRHKLYTKYEKKLK